MNPGFASVVWGLKFTMPLEKRWKPLAACAGADPTLLRKSRLVPRGNWGRHRSPGPTLPPLGEGLADRVRPAPSVSCPLGVSTPHGNVVKGSTFYEILTQAQGSNVFDLLCIGEIMQQVHWQI